jgi:hypothetical protein
VTPRTGPARRAAVLLLATLLSAAAVPRAARADASAKSCADCCMLVCIEAEILKARYQKQEYQKLAQRKGLTKEAYDRAEAEMGAIGERFRTTAAQGLESCNYYVPDAQQSIAEQRRFARAGFKPGDYTIATNLESCVINDAAAGLAPLVTPCSGIGDAQVAHEEQHRADCLARTPEERAAMTLAQVAAGEAAGYDAEIAALENLRREPAEACKKKSCERSRADWDAAAERLGFQIDQILQAGGTKPASKSPLSRNRGGAR